MEVFAYVCLRKLFLPSGSSSTAPMSFLLNDFFGSHAPRVFPSSLSLPSEGRDGGGWSRDALVLLPEGFPLLLLDLVQREGWRSLWSRVRCMRARFCLLGSFVDWGSMSCSLAADSCYLFCSGWFSLLISARSARCWGGRIFRNFFLCSRLPLPPHLCTLGEVVGRVGLPSATPVRGPPWPPDLRLGKPGGYFEPALGRMALVCGLVAHAVAPLAVLSSVVGTLWAWIVSFAIFPCAIVGGLRTASIFTAFALVVSVWPVAVF